MLYFFIGLLTGTLLERLIELHDWEKALKSYRDSLRDSGKGSVRDPLGPGSGNPALTGPEPKADKL